MNESAQLQLNGPIWRARDAFLKKVEDDMGYDLLFCRTCEDIKYLKANAVRGVMMNLSGRTNSERFDDDGYGRDEYLELFRNGVGILVVKEFLWFSTRSSISAGEVAESIVWLARVDA